MGIIVANDQGQLLWARRVGGRDAWQFPQGGIAQGESPEEALYRCLLYTSDAADDFAVV